MDFQPILWHAYDRLCAVFLGYSVLWDRMAVYRSKKQDTFFNQDQFDLYGNIHAYSYTNVSKTNDHIS